MSASVISTPTPEWAPVSGPAEPLRGPFVPAIASLPAILILSGLCAAVWAPAAFEWWAGNDGAAEKVQAGALLIALLASPVVTVRAYREREWLPALAFAGLTAAIVFGLGEEVNWGRELWMGGAEQGEGGATSAFHNRPLVDDLLDWAIWGVSGLGVALPLWLRRTPPGWRSTLARLSPPTTLIGYFLVPFAWKSFRNVDSGPEAWQPVLNRFAEISELCLVLGICFAVLHQYRWYRRSSAAGDASRAAVTSVPTSGFTVALMGPDGTGKTSLTAALCADPEFRGHRLYLGTNPAARTMTLPTTRWIEQAKRWSRERQAEKEPEQAWARAMAAGAKFAGFVDRVVAGWIHFAVARGLRMTGRLIVFDRYVLDPAVGNEPRTVRGRLRRWLLRAGAPRPDLIIVLDAPVGVLRARKTDQTPLRLDELRSAYLRLAGELDNAVVLDATPDFESVYRSVRQLVSGRRGRSQERVA